MPTTVHCYPRLDTRKHILEKWCWCEPAVEEVHGKCACGLAVIHNSDDGRELIEEAERAAGVEPTPTAGWIEETVESS